MSPALGHSFGPDNEGAAKRLEVVAVQIRELKACKRVVEERTASVRHENVSRPCIRPVSEDCHLLHGYVS